MTSRRRAPTPEERLIASARSGLMRTKPGSDAHATWKGYVEGLTLKGRVPLRYEGELTAAQELRATGRLAGHLLATKVRGAGPGAEPGAEQEQPTQASGDPEIDPLYFRYAGQLTTHLCQQLLGDLEPDALLDAHGYACARVGAKHGPMSEQAEYELFSWLLDQADVKSTPELFARLRAQRAVRRSAGEADTD
ncbi:MAG TPA: hypothetical protein VG275_12585 [Solirubrobacteraceae bacterium]|jgi:hypothetical protein|nr:hypothetical protein [Solirubrobacteraceae bacterium]